MKVFWFDIETTGLWENVHNIIQLAALIEIDGKVVDKHNWVMRPSNPQNIADAALACNKRTYVEIMAFPDPRKVFSEFTKVLDSHVSKFNRQDKFVPAGFNVGFDMKFLRNYFKLNHHKYFGSYFFNNIIVDPYMMVCSLVGMGKLPEFSDYKLETICRELGIEFDAHDALEDIAATRLLARAVADSITISAKD